MKAASLRFMRKNLGQLMQTAELQMEWVDRELYFFLWSARHKCVAPVSEEKAKRIFNDEPNGLAHALSHPDSFWMHASQLRRCGSKTANNELQLAIQRNYQVLPDYESFETLRIGKPEGGGGDGG